VPINPDYIEKITDEEIVFHNYEGRQYRYPLTSTPLPAKPAPVAVDLPADAAKS